LLTDEVLEELGCGWDLLKSKIDNWLQMNSSHSHYSVMTSFKSAGYNRKDFDFKKIRNDLMHIIGSPLTWEMVVGKVIGNSVSKNTFQYHADSLGDYLGKNLIEA
jgi:hypothetical protein